MAKYLNLKKVLDTIERALYEVAPLSLVRIGDGENLVMAQQSVWSISKVLREPWAIKANQGEKGVTLPNLALRDEMVRSIKEATIVGLLPLDDDQIKAPDYLKRKLTNEIFSHYQLNPTMRCHACVNRMMPESDKFWRMLKHQRILLVTRNPAPLEALLTSDRYKLNVTHKIAFSHYDQIKSTMKEAVAVRNRFDIALLSCGVNAVVLAPRIANETGKVAIDFGKGPDRIITAAKLFPKRR
ncbi:conserved hypothetical protein [Paenibacillus curdlanolyticus YK9]|uniref:GT-D fold-like domain-containing protein n=1 Tax=Paenibacillus curdlanolyticus YK9 TaxID=717606 RepID=E0IAK9_9BACL|nr:GT-D fold domain-containing glycosyltransferase [Paenibacillus curdlanolyticus]EFM10413.1 conserved hypothetical protein [Paenibacillus curdlanolyticus YK9]